MRNFLFHWPFLLSLCTCILCVHMFIYGLLAVYFIWVRVLTKTWAHQLARWAVQRNLGYLLFLPSHCNGYRYVLTCSVFKWVLGIQTQVLMFVRQALFPLSHLHIPSLDLSKENKLKLSLHFQFFCFIKLQFFSWLCPSIISCLILDYFLRWKLTSWIIFIE